MILRRVSHLSSGIFGVLLKDDGTQIAYTLEHAYPVGSLFDPKIPNGTFKCVRGPHRLHNMTADFTTFEITGVAGHSDLLFHWGNYNKDSEGCVLLGEGKQADMITNSRECFAKFMELLDGVDEFTLTVC